MVDYGFLIGVLNIAFNVGGKSLDWFKSYLYTRSCKVNIGDSFSQQSRSMFLSSSLKLMWPSII